MTAEPDQDADPFRTRLPAWTKDAAIALISGLLVLAGQLIMSGPPHLKAEASYVTALQTRISDLEARLGVLAATNTELRIEIASLQASLDSNVNFQDLLCSILDAQPGLNWAKVATRDDDGVIAFRMACLDVEYRARFGIAPFQYIGQTDFAIWPEAVAEQFYENDLIVLTSRQPLIKTERWQEGGQWISRPLTKFYFEFENVEFVIGHLPSG